MSAQGGSVRFSRNGRASWPSWRKVLTASVITLAAGLVWLSIRQVPREPVYLGKPLTFWLRTYAPASSHGRGSREWNQADEAVRHIGTNCLPILLEMIRERDSQLKLRLVALAQKQPFIKIHFVLAAERNAEASKAFIALGDMAKGAVPALAKMCNENISADSQAAIEDAFAWVGPPAKPAVPFLLQAATNSNPKVRANALWALGEIHADPGMCVPQLIQGLSDTDQWARLSAAHALGMFGTNAQSAVPSLAQLTNMSTGSKSFPTMNWQVMFEARNAIKKIRAQVASPSTATVPEFRSSTDWSIPAQ